MLFLKPHVMNYDWGKKGQNSLVAQLLLTHPDFIISKETPYAELWLGSHQNGSSKIIGTNTTLKDIPILLKVLSIDKPLSIQIHPNSETARTLNTLNPSVYKDANPKPEMTIAITQFELFCGFRPINDFICILEQIPQLSTIFGSDVSSYKIILNHLLNQDETLLNNFTSLLISLFKNSRGETQFDNEIQWFIKLNQIFPNDVGCYFVFVMKYYCLNPGESIFISPHQPHFYLCGDAIECMVNSDNVIRCGLTNKFKDIPTFLKLVDTGCAEQTCFSHQCGPMLKMYYPINLFRDLFQIGCLEISLNESFFDSFEKSALWIVIKGEGSVNGSFIQKGTLLYFDSKEQVCVKSYSEKLRIFIALWSLNNLNPLVS